MIVSAKLIDFFPSRILVENFLHKFSVSVDIEVGQLRIIDVFLNYSKRVNCQLANEMIIVENTLACHHDVSLTSSKVLNSRKCLVDLSCATFVDCCAELWSRSR